MTSFIRNGDIKTFYFFFCFYSTPLLHRCVPTGHEAIQEAYDLLNSWSIAQQLFSDLYNAQGTILIVCGIAFG